MEKKHLYNYLKIFTIFIVSSDPLQSLAIEAKFLGLLKYWTVLVDLSLSRNMASNIIWTGVPKQASVQLPKNFQIHHQLSKPITYTSIPGTNMGLFFFKWRLIWKIKFIQFDLQSIHIYNLNHCVSCLALKKKVEHRFEVE